MKTSKILYLACCAAAVFLLCVSAGCIGSGGDDDSLKNTLVYAGEGSDTLNPVINDHTELVDLIFSGLMKYDANANPVPDLAESCVYDSDTKTYTFLLKKGVVWHDGKPFTSADVVYTYELLALDDNFISSVKSNYQDILSVSAPDEYTVVFVMKDHNAAMLSYFTRGIVPKHILAGQDVATSPFNQNPVGTGRYKFVEWDRAGNMIVLARNTDYYGQVPTIERIIYKVVASMNLKTTMLTTGEADLAWVNANYANTFRGNAGYQNFDFRSADYRGISMNFNHAFWKNNADSVAVLNYAIDKNAIVRSVAHGHGFAAYSPIQLSEYGGNTNADIYSYDPQKFAREMEKLGWVKGSDGIYERNGQKFHFTIQVRGHEEERIDIANLCSRMLKEAGVDMEIVVVTKFEWDKGYNGFLSGYAAQFDPDMVYANYVTGASDNTMQYSNAEVDRLLTAGRHETDTEKRKALYQEFETVYAKSPGIVLTAYLDGNYVSIAGLSGLDTTRVLGHHAVGVMWNIEEWTLSK